MGTKCFIISDIYKNDEENPSIIFYPIDETYPKK